MKNISLLFGSHSKLRLGLTLLIATLIISGCAKKYPPGHPKYVGSDAPSRQVNSKSSKDSKSSNSAQLVVKEAISLQGTPYKAGGTSPKTGFDCSGFTSYVYKQAAGVNLPRTSFDQFQVGFKVASNKLQPGDLVFFRSNKSSKISHVGIYVKDNKFIHAPTSKGKVRAESLNLPYWGKNYVGAKRILR